MFTTKKKALITPKAKPTKVVDSKVGKPVSAFIQAGMKNQAVILSGNGSKKFSTTGNPFVDQFGKLGTYKAPRPFAAITNDAETLWAEDPLNAVKFIAYLRTITRKVTLFDGTATAESQRGGELKHEAIMRFLWLSQKSPKTFWKNIEYFISLGSWHDLFAMLQQDLVFHGWDGRILDWKKFGDVILAGLKNKNTSELVKKYLPSIKSNSVCKTVESQANNLIGKWVCSLLFGQKESAASYKKYRVLKSKGTAHEWQKLISQERFSEIDFGDIHGRALNLLVRSKFLKNQGLSEKFSKWVTKPTTKVKYTGFVHELFAFLPNPHRGGDLSIVEPNVRDTVNKQFDTLVEKGKTQEQFTNFIVVRDTSGSMSSSAQGTTMSCYNIAKALALYFSEFLTGPFANAFIEFNSDAKMHTWKGNNALEKWFNDKTSVIGTTEFQSVFELFATLKRGGVPESEFPTGILCISDGEFNPDRQLNSTNVEGARAVLKRAGFSAKFVKNFKIVLWNLQSRHYGSNTGSKFETYGNVENVFYFSGYSAATIAFLTGEKIKTAADVFDEAMSQEVLSLIEL
jgi:hypothetical protein